MLFAALALDFALDGRLDFGQPVLGQVHTRKAVPRLAHARDNEVDVWMRRVAMDSRDPAQSARSRLAFPGLDGRLGKRDEVESGRPLGRDDQPVDGAAPVDHHAMPVAVELWPRLSQRPGDEGREGLSIR